MEDTVNITKLFNYLLKKWKFIFLGFVTGAALFFCVGTFVVNPSYSASSLIYIKGTSSITASLSDLQIGTYLSKDYEIIFKSRPVLERTIKKLKLETSTSDLNDMISISTITDTRIIRITCKANDPDLAKDIANTLAQYGIEMVNEIDAKQPFVVERAISNNEPVSLSTAKFTLLGMVCGTLVSVFVIVLVFILNNRIMGEDDLEELGLAVLGQVYEDELFNNKSLSVTNDNDQDVVKRIEKKGAGKNNED